MLPKFVKKLFLAPILLVVLLVLNSLIEPMKTLVDIPRVAMNCPNTATFDSVAWNALNAYQHTIYSTGCYMLNWSMLLFIGLLIIIAIWGWMTK